MLHFDISHLSYETALARLQKVFEDKNHIICHVDFGAEHSQSKIIRDFVGMIFDAHGITHPWRGRFILITDELINNAIEHGSKE
jgi:anti-sigma regulatory factor (Ser/Thr protein kinase)